MAKMRTKTTYPKGIHERMNEALKQGEVKEGFQALKVWLSKSYPDLVIPAGTINSWAHSYKTSGDVRGRGAVKPKLSVVEKPLSVTDVADALLTRAVKAIDDSDFKDDQLRMAKKNIARLEDEQRRLANEVDRILKLHNEQVRNRDVKLIQAVGDVNQLMTKARLRR